MPSAVCENPKCRAVFTAKDADDLFTKTIAHHRGNMTEGLIISLFGRQPTKDRHHACRDFQIFTDDDVNVGTWHFANGEYSDQWSTAVLRTRETNSRHRFDIQDRGDRTDGKRFYARRGNRS